MSGLVWDSAHKGASTTLSAGDANAQCKSGAGVRGTIAHDASDPNGYYFEVAGVSSSDGFSSHFFGLANSTWSPADDAGPTTALGYDANGWSISTNRNSYPTSPFTNNTPNGVAIGTLPLNNFGSDFITATIGVLLKAGKMTLYGTGGYAGIVIDAFTGLTGYFYPALSCYPGTARDVVIAINGTSGFAGTLPTGAAPWSTVVNQIRFMSLF